MTRSAQGLVVPTARPKINLLKSRRSTHAAGRAVRDTTLVAWYRSFYAPRTGGAYDSPHRTAAPLDVESPPLVQSRPVAPVDIQPRPVVGVDPPPRTSEIPRPPMPVGTA